MATISGSTKLTRKGQITIPQAVREALGLKEGDALVVAVEEVDGCKRATVKSARAIIDELYGSVKPVIPQDEPLDVDELLKQARRDMAERQGHRAR